MFAGSTQRAAVLRTALAIRLKREFPRRPPREPPRLPGRRRHTSIPEELRSDRSFVHAVRSADQQIVANFPVRMRHFLRYRPATRRSLALLEEAFT